MDGEQRRASSNDPINAYRDAQSPDSFESMDILSRSYPDSKTTIAAMDCKMFRQTSREDIDDTSCEAQTASSGSTCIGRPATKPIFYTSDVLATILSIACCAVAILVVVNNFIAWSLGYNNQLIMLGFLLSIMNLCLRIVAPMFLCQLEAVTSSRLQNYEAILRFRPHVSQAGWLWRMIITLMLALPIGLSVGYKRFAGGTATVAVTRGWREYNDRFGLYPAPGLQPLGSFTGSSFMINATAPVIQASRAGLRLHRLRDCFMKYSPKDDPPLPSFPKAFGIATLVLNESAVAILDTPHPDWMTQMQSTLDIGESLKVSTVVLATVTTASDQINSHRHEDQESTFWQPYTKAGRVQRISGYSWGGGPYVGLLSVATKTYAQVDEAANSSWAFVSLGAKNSSWSSFASNARMYTTTRKLCKGVWVINQAGAQLVKGNCATDLKPQFHVSLDAQRPFTTTNVYANVWDPMQLGENLMTFVTARTESRWLETVVSTTMAGMIWSRAVLWFGPGSADWMCGAMYLASNGTWVIGNPSLKYAADPKILYTRPALQKSPWLYLIFLVQPAFTLLMLLIGVLCLAKTPLGKGFGITAILAGVDHSTLPILQGSGFSGKLREPVQLRIDVRETEAMRADVTYHVERKTTGAAKDSSLDCCGGETSISIKQRCCIWLY